MYLSKSKTVGEFVARTHENFQDNSAKLVPQDSWLEPRDTLRRWLSEQKHRKLTLLTGLLLLALIFASSTAALADSFLFSIPNTSFIIPLNEQSATLNLHSDGTATSVTSADGTDPLGSQSFVLGASSFGNLTLNLHFTGMPLGQVTEASIQFTVSDFDFLPDHVTSEITLQEMAILDAVNNTPLASADQIDLTDYLPSGTTVTDNQTITLDPIPLMPPLTASDFIDPFILSLTLSAEAYNTGSSISVVNTPEQLLADISLTVSTVPEPSTILLLASGLAGLCFFRRRKKAA